MNTTDYTAYFNEVVRPHIDIEQWFSRTADRDALTQLLARFSPQFWMIVPNGNMLDFLALNELFDKLGGARLGLKTSLSELRGIDSSAFCQHTYLIRTSY